MAPCSHVLIGSVLGRKISLACFAIVSRSPVVSIVHMLVASAIGGEAGRASLAFWPIMLVIEHVLMAIVPVVEGLVAVPTVVHFDANVCS
jgi:hypothetical protein